MITNIDHQALQRRDIGISWYKARRRWRPLKWKADAECNWEVLVSMNLLFQYQTKPRLVTTDNLLPNIRCKLLVMEIVMNRSIKRETKKVEWLSQWVQIDRHEQDNYPQFFLGRMHASCRGVAIKSRGVIDNSSKWCSDNKTIDKATVARETIMRCESCRNDRILGDSKVVDRGKVVNPRNRPCLVQVFN